MCCAEVTHLQRMAAEALARGQWPQTDHKKVCKLTYVQHKNKRQGMSCNALLNQADCQVAR